MRTMKKNKTHRLVQGLVYESYRFGTIPSLQETGSVDIVHGKPPITPS